MSLRIDPNMKAKSATLESTYNAEKSDSDFGQALIRIEKLQHQKLQDFLTKLSTQGKKLADSLSLRDLADFRDMVKSFLRSTFGQSRQLQENSVWDYSGRPKVMARITRINEALEDLGRKVLEEQAKPMDILGKIDEIKGLIVDLFA